MAISNRLGGIGVVGADALNEYQGIFGVQSSGSCTGWATQTSSPSIGLDIVEDVVVAYICGVLTMMRRDDVRSFRIELRDIHFILSSVMHFFMGVDQVVSAAMRVAQKRRDSIQNVMSLPNESIGIDVVIDPHDDRGQLVVTLVQNGDEGAREISKVLDEACSEGEESNQARVA